MCLCVTSLPGEGGGGGWVDERQGEKRRKGKGIKVINNYDIIL